MRRSSKRAATQIVAALGIFVVVAIALAGRTALIPGGGDHPGTYAMDVPVRMYSRPT